MVVTVPRLFGTSLDEAEIGVVVNSSPITPIGFNDGLCLKNF